MGLKTKIKIPIYLQILAGMCVGIVGGLIALNVNGQQFVTDWVRPWGQLFIRLLQLVAVPLVFVSLVKGVIGMSDISKFSKMGLKTVGLYMITTVIAITLGVVLVSVVKPGRFFDAGQTLALEETYSQTVNAVLTEQNKQEGPLNFLNDIVPNNIINALGDNRKMLQIIFFALLFGVAALSVGKDRIKPILSMFDSLNEVILKMVNYIIQTAPYGVMALMAGLVVDSSGDIGLFSALAVYGVTVVVGLFILILGFYPLLIKLFTKTSVRHFLNSVYPLQLLAFSTSSSSAVLPVTMDVAKNKLGVSEETTSFVLPLGATINMDGTSCFQAISVIFIAQALGLDLSLTQILTIILMTTLSSIGTPGVPGGSYVVMTMVLTSVGIPPQGLALILGIDRPLDMLRTSVNVTGDLAVSSIIDKK